MANGHAFPPLPARAEPYNRLVPAGREPNLYLYEQKRIGAVLCVLRRPRPDHKSSPSSPPARRRAPHVRRREEARAELAPAPNGDIVEALLDRVASVVR